MTKLEKVIKGFEFCIDVDENCYFYDCPYVAKGEDPGDCNRQALNDALSLLKAKKKWIPFVKRQLTEEEKRNHPGWCFILDGEVPDDEQEILLYRPWKNKDGYIIEMDRYINNGDTVYLEGAMDIENGMFWMPLPEPPKEG